MGNKTLGIIGLGEVVLRIFHNSNFPTLLKDLGRVVFYNYGYKSDEAMENTDKFKQIISKYKSVGGTSVPRANHDFSDFFIDSDVILDATGGWAGWERNSGYSLVNYARAIANGERKTKPQFQTDLIYFKEYQQEKAKIPERIIQDESEFEIEFKEIWDFSKSLIDAIETVDNRFKSNPSDPSAIGIRMYDEFPFVAHTMMERGGMIKEAFAFLSKDDTKAHKLPPTYINVVNEPCMTSNLLSGACPEFTPYLVGCTGFDLTRLEKTLNEENEVLRAIKKKAGIEGVLRILIFGYHDKKGLMPYLYSLQEQDQVKLDAFLNQVDYKAVYNELKVRVGAYYQEHPIEVNNQQVDESIIHTIKYALESRGKAWSVYPNHDERPLCNSYYQPVFEEGKGGMFLIGPHRFRNGKVWRERAKDDNLRRIYA